MFEAILVVLMQAAPVGAAETDVALPTPTEVAPAAGEGAVPAPANEDIVVTGDAPETSRKVCVKEKKVGTNIARTVCRTVAQIKDEASAARTAAGEISTRRNRDQAAALRSN